MRECLGLQRCSSRNVFSLHHQTHHIRAKAKGMTSQKWLLRYSLTTKGNFPLLYRSQLYFILDLISYLWLILRGDAKSTENAALKYQEFSISLGVLLWLHVWKERLIFQAAVYCLPHSIILDQENNIIDLKFPKFNQLWDTILV